MVDHPYTVQPGAYMHFISGAACPRSSAWRSADMQKPLPRLRCFFRLRYHGSIAPISVSELLN
jgi:hypothetical protein